MNSSSKLRLLVLPAITALSGTAIASPGTEAPVTLMMIEQYSVPGTILKDEFGVPVRPTTPAYENEWARYDSRGNLIQENYEYRANVASWRLSNREFLGFLVSEGVISNITGWSLKAIYNEESELPHFYITRPGVAPIYVGGYFDLATYGEASAVNARSQTRYNSAGTVISSTSIDDSTTKSELFVTFSTQETPEGEGSTMNLQGMWRHTLSLRPVGGGQYRYLNGPGAITGISGSINDVIPDGSGGFDYFQSILEGSWSFLAGRPINDLSVLYPEAEPVAAK
jgi:hypothetical protein